MPPKQTPLENFSRIYGIDGPIFPRSCAATPTYGVVRKEGKKMMEKSDSDLWRESCKCCVSIVKREKVGSEGRKNLDREFPQGISGSSRLTRVDSKGQEFRRVRREGS